MSTARPRLNVAVHVGQRYDPELVARVLGEPPLPTDAGSDMADVEDPTVAAPFITIEERIHRPTSDYLRELSSSTKAGTTKRVANDLRGWLDFLCNDRGMHPHEDYRDPVFAATESDFAAYWRLRQYGPAEELLSGDGWAHASGSIKRFYEYAERAYFHAPPFEIRTFSTPEGYRGTTLAKYRPRRRRISSAGLPLTPAWSEQLLMGALRVDLAGRQDAYAAAERDHAIINLCLGTGMRRHNLTYITTYEVPPVTDLPITVTRVADLITKYDAGSDALTFTHRLLPVHDYIAGPRAEIVTATRHEPMDPLHIVYADVRGVAYRDPASGDAESVTKCAWPNADEKLRARLVNPDGTSPILFLNALSGAPLAYSSYQHVVADAARFVRQRVNPDFPVGFRLHDLRHTYAVHLVVAIYRNVIADSIQHRTGGPGSSSADAWVVDHLAAAVELVQYSLGHAGKGSTRLYLQTAHRFLDIPLEEFLGWSTGSGK